MDEQTREQLRQLIHDEIGNVVREDPQVVLSAMANDPDGMRAGLTKLGFSVREVQGITPDDVVGAKDTAMRHGRLDGGFGAHFRAACRAESWHDPRTGRKRLRYVYGEAEQHAEAWFRALWSKDLTDPETGRGIREIRATLEKFVRAPTDPFLGETGENAASLVPTLVAAQVFEVMNEMFVLKGMVQVFTSDAPLNIPRRIGEVAVSRGGRATQIDESVPDLDDVKLSPERAAVLAYIDPVLAGAAAVGPVLYVTEQIGEAMAKDDQRVILTGLAVNREPRGILNLPTAGPAEVYDRAKTEAYVATSRDTQRQSVRRALFKIGQRHRQSDRFVWVTNSDGIAVLANHNDTDQRPFDDQNDTYLRKPVVESEAIATALGETTLMGGDMRQYAWLEALRGLRFDTTTVGGEAWNSDAIGVKAVQYVDGAPVTPPTFVIVPDVAVP